MLSRFFLSNIQKAAAAAAALLRGCRILINTKLLEGLAIEHTEKVGIKINLK